MQYSTTMERTFVYHVRLLDLYLQKLPPEAIERDIFYIRPLDKIPLNDPTAPWYTSVPVGRNTLDKKVNVMCRNAGLEGHQTNHSLRATGATEMYQGNVPEKLIQERTGHRLLKSLRVYERSTDEQHKAVSTLLSTAKETVFQEQHSLAVKQSNQTVDIQPVVVSGSVNFSFQNLTGCTINIVQEKPSTVQ